MQFWPVICINGGRGDRTGRRIDSMQFEAPRWNSLDGFAYAKVSTAVVPGLIAFISSVGNVARWHWVGVDQELRHVQFGNTAGICAAPRKLAARVAGNGPMGLQKAQTR